MEFPHARILILAKAPRPGSVKTRLVPPLTPRQAAELQSRLLVETVARLAGARLAPVELWCSPAIDAPPFPALGRAYGVRLRLQRGADLGERMRNAADEALRRACSVALVGADCPGLDADYVRTALQALTNTDAVLGPAEDGGYVLLGLKRTGPELFSGVPWGTGAVADTTRERLRGLGWGWRELPVLWDLDRPTDLARYHELLNAEG
jgi:rSAM/selenodomain-associated transferase 1